MKKITLLVLACTLCASVGFAQNKKALRAKTMKVENTEAVSSRLFTPAYKFTKAQVTSTPRMLANDASAVIVEEDFSKFTAGSETAPDATDLAKCTDRRHLGRLHTSSGMVGCRSIPSRRQCLHRIL